MRWEVGQVKWHHTHCSYWDSPVFLEKTSLDCGTPLLNFQSSEKALFHPLSGFNCWQFETLYFQFRPLIVSLTLYECCLLFLSLVSCSSLCPQWIYVKWLEDMSVLFLLIMCESKIVSKYLYFKNKQQKKENGHWRQWTVGIRTDTIRRFS